MLQRKSGLPIGRPFGIPVRLDLTWFFLALILVPSLSGYFTEQNPALAGGSALALAFLTLVCFAGSLIAHEFGHILTARRFGINTHEVVLFLLGAVAKLEGEPRKASHEFWISAAGPAVSFVLAIAFNALAFAAGVTGFLSDGAIAALFLVGGLNLMLGVFNCLPGFPMDGGRVLRAAVWGVTGNFLKATRVASAVGQGFALLLVALGVYALVGSLFGASALSPISGIFWILLGLFLRGLARMSLRQAEVQTALEGVTVRDLMRPVHVVVPADMDLEEITANHLRRFPGTDQFPVVEGERLLGCIRREDVTAVPERQRVWTHARELVRPYRPEEALEPGAMAMTALQVIAQARRPVLAVFEGRRLLGFVFQSDLVGLLTKNSPRGPQPHERMI